MALEFLPFIISTLGYIGFAVTVLKVRVLLAPLLWACFVVTLVYTFALVGLLELGARVTLVLGVLLGLTGLWRLRHHVPKPKVSWSVAILFAIPFVVAFAAIPNDFLFLAWDEVGYWAKMQKFIFDTNALLDANSPQILRSYPPGQQLFQYYFTKATWWSEPHLLFAQNLFLLSGLLALVGALITRTAWAVIVYFTLIPVIYYFHFDYTTIYADPMLASVFAGCLGVALKPRLSLKDDIVLAICLCGFVLLKDIAAVFAALTLSIYGVNAYYGNTESPNHTSSLSRAFNALSVCGLALFAVLVSWHWYVSGIGSSKSEVLKVNLQTLTEVTFQNRVGATVTNFAYHLLKPDYFSGQYSALTIQLSLAGVTVLLLALGTIAIILSPARRRGVMFFTTLGMFVGSIAYLLLLLWLYLTYFTEYEGTRLASFDRYSMTYFVTWTLVAYALLISVLLRFKAKKVILIPLAVLILALAFVPKKFYSDAKKTPIDQVSFEKKKQIQALVNEVKKYTNAGDLVYFIAQNTNGYERQLFDYAMLPNPQHDCWSIGKKYDDGDVWSCDRPLGFFLQGYAYVVIYYADARFWLENQGLFTPEGRYRQSGVYKVNRQTDGQLLLVPTN
jgi:hypothetical protein